MCKNSFFFIDKNTTSYYKDISDEKVLFFHTLLISHKSAAIWYECTEKTQSRRYKSN
mgnify:CR=1 FL=1